MLACSLTPKEFSSALWHHKILVRIQIHKTQHMLFSVYLLEHPSGCMCKPIKSRLLSMEPIVYSWRGEEATTTAKQSSSIQALEENLHIENKRNRDFYTERQSKTKVFIHLSSEHMLLLLQRQVEMKMKLRIYDDQSSRVVFLKV